MSDVRERIKNVVDEMQDEIVGFAQELFRIPSFTYSPEEKTAIECVAKKWQEMGLETEFVWGEGQEHRPNVIGHTPGKFEHELGFSGHVDVVPVEPIEEWVCPPFAAEIKDGKIIARGAADCKGGIVCYTFLPEIMRRAGIRLKGGLTMCAIIDEEVGSYYGMKTVIESGKFKPDACIQGDPSGGAATFTIAHKGSLQFQLKCYGQQFHAAFPHKGINATMKLINVVKALDEKLIDRLPPREHELFPEGHQLVLGTTFHAGTNELIIPDYAETTVRFNVLPGYTHDEVFGAVQSLLDEMMAADPDLKVEIEERVWNPGDNTPKDHKVVTILSNAVQEVCGFTPQPWGFPSGSMTAFTCSYGKIPNVVWGCGSSENNFTHCPNEWISLAELNYVTKAYALAAIDFLGYEEV